MDILIVVCILIAVFILFATEYYPVELVAFMALGALLLFQQITPREAISGFSNPAVITVASMFVVSGSLVKTGALQIVAQLLLKWGKSPLQFLVLMMGIVAISSSLINNTGIVAVFLPIISTLAIRSKIPLSKLLIPLSFASQAGGVCTLIGSSTNLIVSSIAENYGLPPFSMFEMARIGLLLVVFLIVYFVVIGRFLLPTRESGSKTKAYHLGEYITELRVKENSSLIGKTIREAKLVGQHDVKVMKLIRNDKTVPQHVFRPLEANDLLLVKGKIKNLLNLKEFEGLEIEPEFQLREETLKDEDIDLAEALIPPNSRLNGYTLKQSNFQQRYNVIVLGIRRLDQVLGDTIANVPLRVGDILLLQGHKDDIMSLRGGKNLIIMESIEEGVVLKKKAPLALLILAMVILLPVLNIMPIVTSAIIGCILILLTRCLSIVEMYDSIDFPVIFLLAGIIPLGIALEKSGAALLIVTQLTSQVKDLGPYVALSLIYLLTTILTEMMSNNATAVLLSPIAITLAAHFGVDPKPFLLAVAFAASTSFLTPIGYQTNTMVYAPGGYHYLDFFKVGLPLNIIFWVVSSLLIPYFWPFS